MRSDPLDLRLLRYFVHAAHHLSFTVGAQHCGVSQSALSQGIKSLEQRLGLPLFDRGDRRIMLTAAGEALLHRARRLLADAADAELEMRGFAGAEAGFLRVGVVQTVNSIVIPGAIARLATQYPAARFDIREMAAPAIEEEVAAGALELGVSFHPATRPSLLIEPLGEERLLVLQAASRPVPPHGVIQPARLQHLPLALLQRGFCTRALVDTALGKAGYSIVPRLEMNSIAALLHIVSKGEFVTIMPELAQRMPEASALRGFAIQRVPLRRRLIILRRQSGFYSPLAHAFTAAVRAAL